MNCASPWELLLGGFLIGATISAVSFLVLSSIANHREAIAIRGRLIKQLDKE